MVRRNIKLVGDITPFTSDSTDGYVSLEESIYTTRLLSPTEISIITELRNCIIWDEISNLKNKIALWKVGVIPGRIVCKDKLHSELPESVRKSKSLDRNKKTAGKNGLPLTLLGDQIYQSHYYTEDLKDSDVKIQHDNTTDPIFEFVEQIYSLVDPKNHPVFEEQLPSDEWNAIKMRLRGNQVEQFEQKQSVIKQAANQGFLPNTPPSSIKETENFENDKLTKTKEMSKTANFFWGVIVFGILGALAVLYISAWINELNHSWIAWENLKNFFITVFVMLPIALLLMKFEESIRRK